MTENLARRLINSVAAGHRLPWPLRCKYPKTGMGVSVVGLADIGTSATTSRSFQEGFVACCAPTA
jgi:hypothetical protein